MIAMAHSSEDAETGLAGTRIAAGSPLRDEVVLATADSRWAETARDALDASGLRSTAMLRVASVSGIEVQLGRHARLWIVDEAWVAPLLARRRQAPHERQPDLLVRFQDFSTARVVAMVESGARGCLPAHAGVEETQEAIRAVLAGELWLSRRLFSAVLDHLQARSEVQVAMDDDESLTTRQREIVQCVSRGMSNKQIGRHLGISPTTVKTHLHNIFERLGIGGRTLLALRASEGHMH
jgi:DNA-binding NarL/FixJ family response regulator